MTRRRPIKFLATAAALPVIALIVAGCGSSGGGSATASTAPPTTASGGAATVGVASNGSLGRILVDSQGRTLYMFQADKGTKSACTGECVTDWPPLRASGMPTAGSGIVASKLGTSVRTDGKPQVTYNGHPLYRFANDNKPGDAAGQGLNEFGGLWYVLSSAGATVTGSSAGPSSGSGGNGY
jgi:predicted lipoprotein with Yx(FWY)xxD motif